MSDKKMCPFMTSPLMHTSGTTVVDCVQERCMAWGQIYTLYPKEPPDDKPVYGCKLIGRR